MQRMKENKKGVVSLNEVPGAVLLLVTIGIFLGIGALIIDTLDDNTKFTTGSAALNATQNALAGLEDLSSFQSIIAIVVAAAVILGIVFLIRT